MTTHVTPQTDLVAPFPTLAGVSLAPVTQSDYAPLKAAADDPDTWAWYAYRGDGEYFDTQFWPQFLNGHNPPHECHFTVRLHGEVVGTTYYIGVSAAHKRLEIGGTWYAKSARGTQVNPVCKYLLLERAFAWGAHRVELKTDSRNAHSRAAMEKLGACYDGTLRRHMILHDGRPRDTAYYSIIPDEWSTIRTQLEQRINALNV